MEHHPVIPAGRAHPQQFGPDVFQNSSCSARAQLLDLAGNVQHNCARSPFK